MFLQQAIKIYTRNARARETNCLHYANAVQLQLTVAKNRCRYRRMLSRASRGFLSLPPFVPFGFCPCLSFVRCPLRLFLVSEDSPTQFQNEMVPRVKIDRIAFFPSFLLCTVEKFHLPLVSCLSLYFFLAYAYVYART